MLEIYEAAVHATHQYARRTKTSTKVDLQVNQQYSCTVESF